MGDDSSFNFQFNFITISITTVDAFNSTDVNKTTAGIEKNQFNKAVG